MMASYDYPTAEVQELRNQGLADTVIIDELSKRGYSPQQIQGALAQVEDSSSAMPPPMRQERYTPSGENDGFSGRLEEIAESIIDEKWEDLLSEVRKIIEWKDRIEEKQTKLMNDLQHLKEDFATLHQGVLGKLQDYDDRMADVGTELKAVGKVFKDVVPEFVENVKELSSITGKMKVQHK